MEMDSFQMDFFPEVSTKGITGRARSKTSKKVEAPRNDLSGSFVNNMSLPIHRWFRYSAGFSATWVASVLEEHKKKGAKNIFDPFVGSGTVLLEVESTGLDGIGVESHPFIARVAEAKLLWGVSPTIFTDLAANVLRSARVARASLEQYPELIRRCYSDTILADLDRLRTSFEKVRDDAPESKILWLALTSILRECSPVGTAQWQYVLPSKSKVKTADPFLAFERKVRQFAADMKIQQDNHQIRRTKLVNDDIRTTKKLPSSWGDLLITSPPYANNYDYADATRLEMSFWGELSAYSELQVKVRRHLVRACTQHVAGLRLPTKQILASAELAPIRDELGDVCAKLSKMKESHGGRKPYDNMIASYFLDLALAWKNIRKVMREGCAVCFVVGDSAPYGIYAPVDEWLGRLALANDFSSYRFEKTRDRNIKWKNRKHTVPLKEGRLWVRG